MGLIIEDGKGSGKTAGVNVENRLEAECITSTVEHHVNHEEEGAYNVLLSQSPTAGDDCIFYMENTNDVEMVIEGFKLGFKNATAVDAEFYVQIGDTGTRNSGTDVVPVNLNAGSGKTASGNFEKGADLDGGSATLAGGSEIERFVFADVQNLVTTNINFECDVILPKNQTLTLWASDAGATYYVTVIFYYHNA